jgi:hypothetical protein
VQFRQQPQPAGQDEPRPGGAVRGEPLLHLRSAGLCLRRAIAWGEASAHRHGSECEWHPRHGARVTRQSHHRHQRTQKKAPVLHQVNHALLAALPPEQVEVEICRADALEVRRGLA